MVILDDVELFVDLVIAQKVGDHHVRADGRLCILMEHIRLLFDVRDDLLAMEAAPLRLERRVLPLPGTGRIDVVKAVVVERPAVHPPCLVEFFGRAVFFFEIGAEGALAERAVAAVAVREDLVVDLPADDAGMRAELFGELFGDDAVFLAHDGRGLAGVAARGDLRAAVVGIDGDGLGIFLEEPARRRAGGRAEDAVDARRIQLVDDFMQPGEVEFPLSGFHPAPGKFADARDVDARSVHTLDVLVHLAQIPQFGIVCGSHINLIHKILLV